MSMPMSDSSSKCTRQQVIAIQLTAGPPADLGARDRGARIGLTQSLTGGSETATGGPLLTGEQSWGIRRWKCLTFNTAPEAVASR